MHDQAQFVVWEPFYLHDLGRVSCVRYVLPGQYTHPAQHLITAGYELHDLDDLDHDLSDLSRV